MFACSFVICCLGTSLNWPSASCSCATCAGILGALIASAPVYLYGKYKGRSQANAAAAQEVIKAYRERAITNGKIQNLDPVGLCVELGGLRDSCAAELRGVAKDHH